MARLARYETESASRGRSRRKSVRINKMNKMGITLVMALGLIAATATAISGASASTAKYVGPTSLPISAFTSNFSVMKTLQGLEKAGTGKVAAILPDTVSSLRYVEFDAPYITKALETAGMPKSQFVVQNALGSDTTELTDAEADITNGATVLPVGYGYEWTGTTYQEKQAQGHEGVIFGFAAVLVFLCLAALYESWSIPLAVLLALPLGLFGAVLAVWLRDYPYDMYTQIGIVTLIGLAAKNAILIVEYARMSHEEGKSIIDAAMEAARLRLRPILMTSFAFILGVVPLALAVGAGAASRRSLGTAVFGGMNAATLLAVFIVPVLYVVIQRAGERGKS